MMHTTIDLDGCLQRQVSHEGLLMERGLRGMQFPDVSTIQRSDRFTAIAPASSQARVSSNKVQKIIEEKGIL